MYKSLTVHETKLNKYILYPTLSYFILKKSNLSVIERASIRLSESWLFANEVRIWEFGGQTPPMSSKISSWPGWPQEPHFGLVLGRAGTHGSCQILGSMLGTLSHCGPRFGPCWLHVGHILSNDGPTLAPSWAVCAKPIHLGCMLVPCST